VSLLTKKEQQRIPPCNSNGSVLTGVCAEHLYLGANQLTGTIPTEVGLLTALGEYIDKERTRYIPPCDSNGLF
jgi:hypothetical protein